MFRQLLWKTTQQLGMHRAPQRKVVLTYHNALAQWPQGPERAVYHVDVTLAQLERQVAWLHQRGWLRPAAALHRPSAPGVFLVFDDGMRNNFSQVVPLLARYGATATFAVCTGLLSGSYPLIWRDWLYLLLCKRSGQTLTLRHLDWSYTCQPASQSMYFHLQQITSQLMDQGLIPIIYQLLKQTTEYYELGNEELWAVDPERFCPLDLQQISQMQDMGHRIASHTVHHYPLSQLTTEQVQYELRESKQWLEEHLSVEIDTIMYPYGTLDTVGAKGVREAAHYYRYGYMNQGGPAKLYPRLLAIARNNITRRVSMAHFSAISSGFEQRFKTYYSG